MVTNHASCHRALLVGWLLVAAGTAVGSTGDAQTARANNESNHAAKGDTTTGRLVLYEFFESAPDIPPAYRGGDTGAILLREHLWYPNPFSSPAVILVVTEPSGFGLEYLDEGSERLDAFEFRDVAVGVYFFVLDEPFLTVRPCTVRLLLDGAPAGEIRVRTDRGPCRM